MNLEYTLLNEGHKRLHIVQFHLPDFQKKAIHKMGGKKAMPASGWGVCRTDYNGIWE
jgi:hypothetical protein